MRTSLATATFALLTASVLAGPCKKDVCNADNCLRAVRASSAKPGPSVGLQDCSSFMAKTITPCGSTTTTTTTQTITASASTQTVTALVTAFPTITQDETVTIVTTIFDTAFVTTPSGIQVSSTVVVPITVTQAAESQAPGKRDAGSEELYGRSAPAVASTCAAVTRAASSVPTYASACSGTVRYSSACSCAGVTGTTVTAAAPTVVTSTSTATSIYTPTVTATQTQIATQYVTEIQTQTEQATLETTATTVAVASAFTEVVPVTLTTTVVVSPPTPTGFLVKISSGPKVGYYAYVNPSTDATGRYIFFTNNVAKAGRFTVDPATGNLQDFNTGYDIYMDATGVIGVVYALDPATAATKANTGGFKCVPASSASGSQLVCNNNRSLNSLRQCGAYLYGAMSTYSTSGCTTAANSVTLVTV